jgi:SWI/SNF-related matrix-associated actin-dependent regulator of chromatin subfamily A3
VSESNISAHRNQLMEWGARRCAGTLSVNIYHGRGREVEPRGLANSDIVLSTYYTVANEALDAQSPLKYVKWFRIVLDEGTRSTAVSSKQLLNVTAHTIRQMKTKLFQSVQKLAAKYRWCLTGTPIQNSLEDLASLVSFIGSHSLDSLVEFRRHIITPVTKGTTQGIQNLRILLDSICLRRTNKLLDLPRVVKEDHYVNFSPTERSFYTKTQAEMIASIKQHDSRDRNSKNYFGVFQLQLQLRRLCNHGTFQKSFSGTSEEDAKLDHAQMFDLLRNTAKAACLTCKTLVTNVKDSAYPGSGIFTACGHLLCSGCFPRYTSALPKSSRRGTRCPLCKEKLPVDFKAGQGKNFNELPMKLFINMESGHGMCVSSKVATLIRDIQNSPNQGKRYF